LPGEYAHGPSLGITSPSDPTALSRAEIDRELERVERDPEAAPAAAPEAAPATDLDTRLRERIQRAREEERSARTGPTSPGSVPAPRAAPRTTTPQGSPTAAEQAPAPAAGSTGGGALTPELVEAIATLRRANVPETAIVSAPISSLVPWAKGLAPAASAPTTGTPGTPATAAPPPGPAATPGPANQGLTGVAEQEVLDTLEERLGPKAAKILRDSYDARASALKSENDRLRAENARHMAEREYSNVAPGILARHGKSSEDGGAALARRTAELRQLYPNELQTVTAAAEHAARELFGEAQASRTAPNTARRPGGAVPGVARVERTRSAADAPVDWETRAVREALARHGVAA